MGFNVLLFINLVVLASCRDYSNSEERNRREVGGALHIITNNAQPIHEDVKPDPGNADKPCTKNDKPSSIELKAVFQVTPPKDAWFEGKSMRKSLPLTSKLDVVRSVSRIITLFVLLISGIFEFYPMLQQLYNTIYSFMYQ